MESSQFLRGRFVLLAIIGLALFWPTLAAGQNLRPVADAGLPRYAATDPVQLDGTESYDPDETSPLTYTWTQVSGPPVAITDEDTAMPTISGSVHVGDRGNVVTGPFVQADEIQTCEFELVVSDGELESLADSVKLVIVPDFGVNTLLHENPPFDPDKPTLIFFGGGDCITGGGTWNSPAWAATANLISFPSYGPDDGEGLRTYYRYGDMLILYLSGAAPDYAQPIQTMGLSTGGQPAIDVGIRCNLGYEDPRYAVNRVSFLDATPYCRGEYSESISTFLSNPVDGEQCWIDNYVSTLPGVHSQVQFSGFHPNVLNVTYEQATDASIPWLTIHSLAYQWFGASLTSGDANRFNNGVVGGAYWSVVGPGKNLQLASTPGVEPYRFEWFGSSNAVGYMALADELTYPGRLPAPVTLLAWANTTGVDGAPDGVVLSCHESENAVGYQLLFGSDPHRVAHYEVVSDTPIPPTDVIRDFPIGQTWWTVRARDAYGSTIYADPIQLELDGLDPLLVQNGRTGKRYGRIGHAILDSGPGDELALDPATYRETIDFRGKPLTITSLNPNDPEIVAATVVRGAEGGPGAVFSTRENFGCVLAGLTLTGERVGVLCRDAAPTIENCNVAGSAGVAIEYWHGYEPTITDCNTVGSVSVRPFVENMTVAKRYASVQAAIDGAGESHELVLSAGICFEDIRLKGKSLVLRSADPADASVVAATVISGTDRAVTFADGEGANCVVSGLTIADANDGIYCAQASPTITNCRVLGNAMAGILLWGGSNPRIANCLIVDNFGVGVKMEPNLQGRTSYHNYPDIINCTIAGNPDAGVLTGRPTIANSIIYFNGSQIVGESATVTYSNVQGGFAGEGNIDADPLFADLEGGDYHLQSPAGRWDPVGETWVVDDAASPCIDTGDPASPVADEPEPNGGRVNMGTYGGTREASRSP